MHRFPLFAIAVLAACTVAPAADALPPRVDHAVPFTSQAPNGNWSDLRKAEGCEEASAIMAMRWVRGGGLTPEDANSEIDAIVRFEQETIGEFQDTSIRDTARIFTEHYGHDEVEILPRAGTDDLRRVLAGGSIALVPVDATKLPTPNYDGPMRHMILVRGYDDAEKVFIANDPGTQRGESFRYPYAAIEAALRNYPTGDDEPVRGMDASILVVRK